MSGNLDGKQAMVLGFATFIASSLCMLRFGLQKGPSGAIEGISDGNRSDKIISETKKKFVYTKRTKSSRFPWEPESLLKQPLPVAGEPLLCTFISETKGEGSRRESTSEKLKIISNMKFHKGKFNVSCPCCQ